MPEETKDEYINRHRKELGLPVNDEPIEEAQSATSAWRKRLNTLLFVAGLAVFTWILLQIFGMMKGN